MREFKVGDKVIDQHGFKGVVKENRGRGTYPLCIDYITHTMYYTIDGRFSSIRQKSTHNLKHYEPMLNLSTKLFIAAAVIILLFMFCIDPILTKIEERQNYIAKHLPNG